MIHNLDVTPPLITIVSPVMNDAWSEHKNDTAPEQSSEVPKRPRGISLAASDSHRALLNSVFITPGAMQLTRIFIEAQVIARAFTNPKRAVFVIP